MRTRFTLKHLKDSKEFYSAIELNLFYAQYYYYKNTDNERIKGLLEYGTDDFYHIFKSINAFNKCFITILEEAEPLAAFPFIRMQVDNLVHLYAETLYPTRILYSIYEKGYVLNQIKIKGQALVQSELRKELGVSDIYKKYSGFIHPSKEQIEADKKILKKYIKDFAKDMVDVNQVILQVLLNHTMYFKKSVK